MSKDVPAQIANEMLTRLKHCSDIIAEVEHDEYQRWKLLVGDCVDQMKLSRGTAKTFVRDTRPQVRSVALQVLSYYWKPDNTFAVICEDLALQDVDREVRIQAIASLGLCYSKTKDYRIGRFLADIVNNDEQGTDIRTVAYHSLLLLSEHADPHAEACFRAIRLLRFPEDIDHSFVNRFLKPD